MKYENRKVLLIINYYIYSIKCSKNDKVYIGKTKDVKYRWMHHRSDLRGGIHHNKYLQKDWDSYGEESFIFTILEECTQINVDDREKYWIRETNSMDEQYGYNLAIGGKGTYGFKHTQEELKKMRKALQYDRVYQFNAKLELLSIYESPSHASKANNYITECILLRCEHRIKKMSLYKNCYWIFESEYLSSNFSWENYMENISQVSQKPKKPYREKHRICQYDLTGNLVKIWESYSDLKSAGYNTSQIGGICRHSRGKKTAKGYIWAFEGYDFSDHYFDAVIINN